MERIEDPPSTGSGGKRLGGTRSRGSKRSGRPNVDVSDVDFGGVPADTARKLERRLIEAALAFDAERFTEAVSLLDSIQYPEDLRRLK